MVMNSNASGGLGAGGGGGVAGRPVTTRRMVRSRPDAKVADAPVTTARTEESSQADRDANTGRVSANELRRQELLARVHPSIFALIERLKKRGSQAAADEAKFVRDGRAEVQVWLVDKTPEAIAELKRLGFEVVLDPTTSKLVIGRIAIDKLSKLAELKTVRYIAPQLSGG